MLGATLALFLAITISSTAAPGDLDTTFVPAANDFETVYSLAIQANGKIVILNRFILLNGSMRGTLARFNSDGSNDSSFLTTGSANNGDIRAIGLQSDGKIVLAGRFSTVGGAPHNNIARVNEDGSLDTSFSTSILEQSPRPHVVYDLAVQADNRILVVGDFVSVNGTPSTGIARLNSDGSVDPTFNRLNLGQGTIFTKVTLQADNRIIIVYGINLTDGRVRRGVARLNADGTQDLAFASTNSDINGEVEALAVQGDGKVIVGGGFTQVKGVDRRIARLNTNGSLDTSFAPTISSPQIEANTAYEITVTPYGRILIGGAFRLVNGVSRNNLARLKADGSLDESFLGSGSGTDFGVHVIELQSDGRVLIGGRFTQVNDTPRSHVARLLNDQPALTNTVSGRVTDANGMGVSNATVILLGNLTGTRVAHTDVAGRFTLLHSSNQHITVFPIRRGFAFTPQFLEFSSTNFLTGELDGNFTAAPSTAPSSIPVLLTEENSLRALALDSVTLVRDPFPVRTPHNFSSDQATRISLFAANVELIADETVQSLTCQARDAQSQVWQLPVEAIETNPGVNWLKQIVVVLPPELNNRGDLNLKVTLRGKVSNEVSIRVR